jgi:hypothetical protein
LNEVLDSEVAALAGSMVVDEGAAVAKDDGNADETLNAAV